MFLGRLYVCSSFPVHSLGLYVSWFVPFSAGFARALGLARGAHNPHYSVDVAVVSPRPRWPLTQIMVHFRNFSLVRMSNLCISFLMLLIFSFPREAVAVVILSNKNNS